MHDADLDHLHSDSGVVYQTRFTSVGIDIGSSTTHLTFSELLVGRLASHFHRKPEVLRRSVIYRSPIILTPFLSEGTIDNGAILAFVERCYQEAGIGIQDVQSGAVICTGEAARRHNARAITETLAKDSGRFVCATAGHHFEALLAAHGSGSVEMSRQVDGAVVNLDIGGGTAKRTVVREGQIESLAAINIGARLIALDADGCVIRAEPAGLTIAQSLGLDASPGKHLDESSRRRLAATMAQALVGFLGLDELTPLARQLLLTDMPDAPQEPFWLVCSGGVSEYIYERAGGDPGDLGPMLGAAFREKVQKRLGKNRLQLPQEGIRATVIGACQFTLQVSGETVYATESVVLPLNNVPVVPVLLDWDNLTPETVAVATKNAIGTDLEQENRALFFSGALRFGYGKIESLAEGIAAACAEYSRGDQLVLIFSHNIARTLGQSLRKHLAEGPEFLCLDEIEVGNLDYLDIGLPPDNESYFPIVVKSLVFKH